MSADRPSWRIWARYAAWVLFWTASAAAMLFFVTLAAVIGIGPP